MGPTSRREPPSRPLLTRIAIRVAIVLVLGLLPTCVSMAVFPAGQRMAAPLACPSETAHTEVVARWGGNSRGGKSLRSDLYCLTADGHGTIPSGARLFVSLLAMWGAIVVGLSLLLRGIALVRGRTAKGTADAA